MHVQTTSQSLSLEPKTAEFGLRSIRELLIEIKDL